MTKDKMNNEEIIEVTVEEQTQVEEPKKESFMTKVKNGAKKHGKTIRNGAIVLGVAALSYALGKNSPKGKSQADSFDDFNDYEEASTDVEVDAE